MKKIVWDLFGGGQNSVYNALDHFNYDIYTFDITEPSHEHQYQVDLSQDNIVDIFKKYPKPDIIVASPLCQSFSNILSMKGGGTCFWKLNEDKTLLIERSVEEFERLKSGFTRNKIAEHELFVKRLGERCINNTLALIDAYKPKFWYIENPQKSLMWKYIFLNRKDFILKHEPVFKNLATYGAYGFLISKPTIFLSNVKMDLDHHKTPKPYHVEIKDGVKYFVINDEFRTSNHQSSSSSATFLTHALPTMMKAKMYGTSGLQGVKFLDKIPRPYQKDFLTSKQFSEGGIISHIPPKLIQDIFKYFVV